MSNPLSDFVSRSVRVLRVSYRPTGEEFNATARITGLGMLLIGAIGYLITLVFSFVG